MRRTAATRGHGGRLHAPSGGGKQPHRARVSRSPDGEGGWQGWLLTMIRRHSPSTPQVLITLVVSLACAFAAYRCEVLPEWLMKWLRVLNVVRWVTGEPSPLPISDPSQRHLNQDNSNGHSTTTTIKSTTNSSNSNSTTDNNNSNNDSQGALVGDDAFASSLSAIPRILGRRQPKASDHEQLLRSHFSRRRVTCAGRNVLFSFDKPTSFGKRNRVSIVEPSLPTFLTVVDVCDVYLITRCDSDGEQEQVITLLREAGAFSAGLNESKVLFCDTDNGRAHMVRHLAPSVHIDDNDGVIRTVKPFVGELLTITGT